MMSDKRYRPEVSGPKRPAGTQKPVPAGGKVPSKGAGIPPRNPFASKPAKPSSAMSMSAQYDRKQAATSSDKKARMQAMMKAMKK